MSVLKYGKKRFRYADRDVKRTLYALLEFDHELIVPKAQETMYIASRLDADVRTPSFQEIFSLFSLSGAYVRLSLSLSRSPPASVYKRRLQEHLSTNVECGQVQAENGSCGEDARRAHTHRALANQARD